MTTIQESLIELSKNEGIFKFCPFFYLNSLPSNVTLIPICTDWYNMNHLAITFTNFFQFLGLILDRFQLLVLVVSFWTYRTVDKNI